MGELDGIRILVVDDEEPFRKLLERNLSRSGAIVSGAGSGEAAIAMLREVEPDLAILDISMPGISGIEFLAHLRAERPDTEAIMLTGHAAIDTAIEAMKLGAYDYLEKPLKMSELAVVVEKALEKRRLASENRTLRDELKRREPPAEIVGESRPMREALALIERVAATSAPVLILGESGTGKELAARAIHRHSPRSDRPFIAINCGALQESLLENELFGHMKGAFTGATAERRGLFEVADRGTMFIDEVCEMGPGVQKKFLRVLENGEFRRLGDSVERKVDVRIVAATNRDMEREVAEGRFREDLYYRLNVMLIRLPSLRERKDDIPLLVAHFLEQYGRRAQDGAPGVRPGARKGTPPRVEPAALEKLLRYDWPGNIRELFNILERGMIVSQSGSIGPEDVPDLVPRAHVTPPPARAAGAPLPAPANGGGAPATLDDIERQHVLRTIQSCGGNKTRAAMELGISLRALYRKLEKYASA